MKILCCPKPNPYNCRKPSFTNKSFESSASAKRFPTPIMPPDLRGPEQTKKYF